MPWALKALLSIFILLKCEKVGLQKKRAKQTTPPLPLKTVKLRGHNPVSNFTLMLVHLVYIGGIQFSITHSNREKRALLKKASFGRSTIMQPCVNFSIGHPTCSYGAPMLEINKVAFN